MSFLIKKVSTSAAPLFQAPGFSLSSPPPPPYTQQIINNDNNNNDKNSHLNNQVKAVRIVVKSHVSKSDKGWSTIAPLEWNQLLQKIQSYYPSNITMDNYSSLIIHVSSLNNAQIHQQDWPDVVKENDVLTWQLPILKAPRSNSKPKSKSIPKQKSLISSSKRPMELNNHFNQDVQSKKPRVEVLSTLPAPLPTCPDLPPALEQDENIVYNQNQVYRDHNCDGKTSESVQLLQEMNDKLAKRFTQLPLGQVQLFVRGLKGEVHTIDCNLDEKVECFKIRVWKYTQVAPEHQRLIWAGRQFSDGDTLCKYNIQRESTVHLCLRLGGGKPILYLYPPQEMEVAVSLQLDQNWQFTHMYPTPDVVRHDQNQLVWNVLAKPDGILSNVSTPDHQVPYLFWEADCKDRSSWTLSPNRAVCMPSAMAARYLDQALKFMGLSVVERSECVTFWLAMLTSKPFVVIDFAAPQQVDQWAPMLIYPRPDRIMRILLLFEPAENRDTNFQYYLPDIITLNNVGLNSMNFGQVLNRMNVLPFRYGFQEINVPRNIFWAKEWGGICLSGGLPNVIVNQ
jgi:hypothetical protein